MPPFARIVRRLKARPSGSSELELPAKECGVPLLSPPSPPPMPPPMPPMPRPPPASLPCCRLEMPPSASKDASATPGSWGEAMVCELRQLRWAAAVVGGGGGVALMPPCSWEHSRPVSHRCQRHHRNRYGSGRPDQSPPFCTGAAVRVEHMVSIWVGERQHEAGKCGCTSGARRPPRDALLYAWSPHSSCCRGRLAAAALPLPAGYLKCLVPQPRELGRLQQTWTTAPKTK